MNLFRQLWPRLFGSILFGLLLCACSAAGLFQETSQAEQEAQGQPSPTPTLTPFQPLPPTNSSLPLTDTAPAEPQIPATPFNETLVTLTPTAGVEENTASKVYLAPYIPEALRDSIILPSGYELGEDPDQAALRLVASDGRPVSLWVYALVAPFPTLPNGVSFEELRRAWQTGESSTFPGLPLLMDPKTYAVFETVWGSSAPDAVELHETRDLIGYAWDHQPAWGIVPFEALEPRWKVLEVDGISPIRKGFDPSAYPLLVTFSWEQAGSQDQSLADEIAQSIQTTNREAGKLTTLAMTGVTAMVRCTAYYMEQRGVTYPAEDIREILLEADITHVSNEIPFAQDCPFPDCFQEGLVFCSDPKYMDLLTDIGTDIVELTGDHFADWGPEAMYYTLELYLENGLPYYGGGGDWEEGSEAVILEHNGNRLAFIGCNGKGRGYATAREDNPGAVWCDFESMHAKISKLQADGFVPVATFQHFEYYTYRPQPNMQADFRSMAESGAAIVSGSQAHQPHGMEFLGDSFLHYGLGNLFFDQFGYCPDRACDDAFIDRHVIYDGRYISTDLIPIKFVDWARPRPMTEEERNGFLQVIFSASGW